MAGVELHKKIIENTRTEGSDQDHFNLIHLSFSSLIEDRTKYVLGESSNNPGSAMAEIVRRAALGFVEQGDDSQNPIVLGIPCNTFHAPVIWGSFIESLGSLRERVQILHMLHESLSLLRDRVPKAKKIGLLSTTGTRESGLWYNLLESSAYEVLQVNERNQELVHEAIYHRQWGLKAQSPASPRAVERLQAITRELIAVGAEAIILGCTELPLALPQASFDGVPLVDPVLALARAMISRADAKKLL